MARRLVWLGAAVVAAALLLFVTHRGDPGAARPGAAGPAKGGRPPAAQTLVSVGQVVQGPFTAALSLSGTVSAQNEVQIAPQVSGKVSALSADIGQQVKAGQTLAVIDDGGVLEQAVASAQAQVTQAQQSIIQAQQAEVQAESQVTQAQTQLEQLQNPAAFVTSTQITQAQLAVQNAESTLAQQQTALTSAQQAMTVTAPAGGSVEYESVTVGQSLSAGQTVMVIVPPGSPVLVQAQVQQQSNFDLQVGDAASVNVLAANAIFAGTVTAVGNGVASASTSSTGGGRGTVQVPAPSVGSVNVTITLSNPSPALRDGMTGEINIFGGVSSVVSQTIQATGTVQYQNDWAVIAPQGGTVTRLPVSAGDDVTSGQTVAQIGGAALQDALDKAKEAVQQAQVQVDQAKASLQALQAPPSGAQPSIAAQEQTVASDQQAVTADQRTILGDRQVVAEDERQVALKQQQISELTVQAPFSGLITARDVSLGAQVSPSTPLFTLQGQVMEVEVPVPQQDVGRVHRGDTVSLVPPASGGSPVTGRVVTITPAATAQSLTFTVYVLPDKPSSALQEGASVAVNLTTEQLANALTMPAQAAQSINGKTEVYVVQNGVLKLVPVTLGLSGTAPGVTGTAQIVSGLQAGDEVVVSDATYLAAGDRVQVSNLSATPTSGRAGGAAAGSKPAGTPAGGKPGGTPAAKAAGSAGGAPSGGAGGSAGGGSAGGRSAGGRSGAAGSSGAAAGTAAAGGGGQ